MTKNNITIDELLTNKHLIQSALPSVAKIIEKAKKNEQIKLVYGETYDQFGLTIDSLKYYFFVSILHEVLEAKGIKVSSSVIIGDLHSIKNKLVENKEELLNKAQARLQLINKIKSVYNLKIEPVLMTQLFDSKDYQNRLNTITPLFQSSEELKSIAKKTVLKNRITQEEEVGFQYTLEEVALITGYDIKVGPPRETYYDQMARELGAKVGNSDFCGLYLKPTYPLGFNFDYFVTHPEIEEYGVTPYKAGSNKLQNNRIVLGSTNLDECKRLLDNSFVSDNPILPNPILDIYLIAKMARFLLRRDSFSISDNESTNLVELKSATYEALAENIYIPLGFK
jgi:hypothetical protein